MTLEDLKKLTNDPESFMAAYELNRQNSQAVGCPVFNVFYTASNQTTQTAYFTTRDQLPLTAEEAQPLIEQFHQAHLNK
jgi:hypothetical protein